MPENAILQRGITPQIDVLFKYTEYYIPIYDIKSSHKVLPSVNRQSAGVTLSRMRLYAQ